jgi:hypothetical protein
MDAVNNDGNTAAHLAFKFGHSELGECVALPAQSHTKHCLHFTVHTFFAGTCFPKAPATALKTGTG